MLTSGQAALSAGRASGLRLHGLSACGLATPGSFGQGGISAGASTTLSGMAPQRTNVGQQLLPWLGGVLACPPSGGPTGCPQFGSATNDSSFSVRDALLAGCASGSVDKNLLTKTLGMDAAQGLRQDYKGLIGGACYGTPNSCLFHGEGKHIRSVAALAKLGYGMPTSHLNQPDPSVKGGDQRVLAKTLVGLLKAFCPSQ